MDAKRGRPKTGRTPKTAAQRAREYRARQAAKMSTLAEAAHMADSAEHLAELASASHGKCRWSYEVELLSRAAEVLAEQVRPWVFSQKEQREMDRLRARVQELAIINEVLRKRLKN